MKCLILKLDNYGKDVETIRLQKVHVNQLLTFQRNFKQAAKGKAVKAKGKTPNLRIFSVKNCLARIFTYSIFKTGKIE